MPLVSPPTSSRTPDCSSSSVALARACSCWILSRDRCSSEPVPPADSGTPVAVSFTAACARAAWYRAFSTSFWLEAVHPGLQRAERLLHLLLLLVQVVALRVQAGDLLLRGSLAVQRLPGQVLAALREGGPCRLVQVVHSVLELLLLQLDLLAGGRDGHQGLLHPGDLIEHVLIGQIEHLVRPLRCVQRPAGLGPDDLVGPLVKGHLGLPSVGVGLVSARRPPRYALSRRPSWHWHHGRAAGPGRPAAIPARLRLLADDVGGILVVAQALKARVAKLPVSGPLAEGDLADQPRLDPVHSRSRQRSPVERRRRPLQPGKPPM